MDTSQRTTKKLPLGRDGADLPSEAAASPITRDSGNDNATLGLFGDTLGAVTLGISLSTASKRLAAAGAELLEHTIRAMKPRDQLEHMVIEQLVWTHMRIQRLTLKSSTIRKPELSLAFDEQINKGMNTYRRTVLALSEYRRGPEREPLVAVQQVNESGAGNVIISPANKRQRKTTRTN